MLHRNMSTTLQAWPTLSSLVFGSRQEEYALWLCWMPSLMKLGEDETHQLASLMEIVGVLIERYEEEQCA